ncbi:hypothetical protein OG473_39015 [Streptomyces anulatus]
MQRSSALALLFMYSLSLLLLMVILTVIVTEIIPWLEVRLAF